jgi:hypothetical protein
MPRDIPNKPSPGTDDPSSGEIGSKLGEVWPEIVNIARKFGLVSPAAVVQGQYGDCFFEAALASLARSADGQQKIQNMIVAEGNGSFVVTFPGQPNSPITVTASDLGDYSTTSTTQWANILETALLKLDDAKPDPGPGQGINDCQSGNVKSLSDALQLLTGQKPGVDAVSPSYSSYEYWYEQQVEQTLEKGLPIITSSDPVPDDQGVADKTYHPYEPKPGSSWPIEGAHAFSILAYDPATQIITLRNPWGSDDQGGALKVKGQIVDGITDDGNGEISMSFDTFMRHFDEIDFAKPATPWW